MDRRPHLSAARPLVALVVALVVVGSAAACSSGDDGGEVAPTTTTTTTTPPTTAETPQPPAAVPPAREAYLAEADARCEEYAAQLDAELADATGDSPLTEEQIAGYVNDVYVPATEALVSDLRAIEPPPADAAQVERILAQADRALVAVAKDPASFVGDAPPAVADLNRRAVGFGFRTCFV